MNSLARALLPIGRVCLRTRTAPLARSIMTSPTLAEKAMENLKVNPYFEKYSKKIATLQETSPEEFLAKLEETEIEKQNRKAAELEARRKCSEAASASSKLQTDTHLQAKPKSLADVMKIELVDGKTADEIKEIWHEYYCKKTGVAAVVPAENFNNILTNAKKHPLFVLPLPRDNGYEFVVCQFSGNEIHFTTLINYQTHKENSPECLTLIHYTDLMESKGIVPMRGEFDTNVLNVTEAQCLANQIQLYYDEPSERKKAILETFTCNPMSFKHMDLVTELETLTLE